MQVLMPISSKSEFFPRDEYFFPKPLVEVNGVPLIKLVLDSLKKVKGISKIIFVIDNDDKLKFSLDRTLSLLSDSIPCTFVSKKKETQGALCSCLLAVDHLEPDIPLIIMNSDQVFHNDLNNSIQNFQDLICDIGLLSFESVHPRWSYLSFDKNGEVNGIYEKFVISNQALSGFSYFKKTSDFLAASFMCIKSKDHLDGRYYISGAINQLILNGKKVCSSKLLPNETYSLYSPSQIKKYEQDRMSLRESNFNSSKNINVIIPAAGEGSRFSKEGWKKPKPFIDLNGSPMISWVIQNIKPQGGIVTLILKDEHIKREKGIIKSYVANGFNIIPLDQPTEGTVSTVLHSRSKIQNSSPLLIANSDQLVDFDVNDFINDAVNRNLDGSILVFRDPSKNPKWSFVEINQEGLVKRVEEKKAISEIATVGIYLFKRGDRFVNAAIDMIISNDRVNNEFYTCPVYNYLIKSGAKIGVYEIDPSKMHGLGTPGDFLNYLKEKNLPDSEDQPSF